MVLARITIKSSVYAFSGVDAAGEQKIPSAATLVGRRPSTEPARAVPGASEAAAKFRPRRRAGSNGSANSTLGRCGDQGAGLDEQQKFPEW